jgi:uncharacterized protein (TIGR03435 family)
LLVLVVLHVCVPSRAVQVGEEAPGLGAMRIINPEAHTEAPFIGLKGKITVIDFWATWCGPCVESMPHWNELAEKFAPKGVQFLAITDENEAVVRRFMKRVPIKSWVGIGGPGASLRDLYGIYGIPATVIINKEGMVVAVTHPIHLRDQHIEEVVATGRSSLRPIEENAAKGDADTPKTEPSTVTNEPPLLELTVKRSPPREPGRGYNMWSGNQERTEITGEHASVESALLNFFDIRKSQLDLRTKLPTEDFEFKARLPIAATEDRANLFSAFFKTSFGLQITRKNEQREVWIATRITTNAPGLSTPVPGGVGGGGNAPGAIDLRRGKIGWALGYFEDWLGQRVIDEIGDTNQYDIHLRWDLPKAELALHEADREIVDVLFTPNSAAEQNLSLEQRLVLQAMRGELSREEMARIPAEKREDYELIAEEMAKPEEVRFTPSKETILKLARTQLGVELKTAQRSMEILVVEAER